MASKRFTLRDLLFCCSVILLIIGGFGYTRGFDFTTNTTKSEITLERLPLGDLRSIVVNYEGTIYCGIGFYSRVQVYDEHGHFLYGIKIDPNEGGFSLDLDKKNNLVVNTYRGNETLVFDKKGLLIKEYQGPEDSDIALDKHEYYFRDGHGIEYEIKKPLFNPHVVRIEDGREQTIISQSFFDWLFMGPFPDFLFMAVGLSGFMYWTGIFSILFEKYRQPKTIRRYVRKKIR